MKLRFRDFSAAQLKGSREVRIDPWKRQVDPRIESRLGNKLDGTTIQLRILNSGLRHASLVKPDGSEIKDVREEIMDYTDPSHPTGYQLHKVPCQLSDVDVGDGFTLDFSQGTNTPGTSFKKELDIGNRKVRIHYRWEGDGWGALIYDAYTREQTYPPTTQNMRVNIVIRGDGDSDVKVEKYHFANVAESITFVFGQDGALSCVKHIYGAAYDGIDDFDRTHDSKASKARYLSHLVFDRNIIGLCHNVVETTHEIISALRQGIEPRITEAVKFI